MKLNNNDKEKQIEDEQAAKARYWKIPVSYDDADDEDYIIAITHKKPDNSLSMGYEHLNTISATESDKFIKSNVENLVTIPSESEGEHECDVPACEVFTTFSNILFDADYDFFSSDDQSFYDEDIPKEIYSNPLFDEEIISMKIDSHHFNDESDLIESLLNHDSPIISSSSKIDSLFDEFAGTGNSFTYDPIPESFDEVQIIPDPPPQFHLNVYLCVNPLIDHHCGYECGNSLNDFFCYQCTCEFCGNGAHVGYNFPAQVPPFQTLPSFPQQYPCCEDYGVTHEPYQCQPRNHDYYNEQNSCYDSNSFGFDHGQPSRYTVNHPNFNAHNNLLDSQTTLMEQMEQLTSMCEMFCQIPVCCDDDDDYNSAITPNETIDSLSMRDEHLDTILEIFSNPLFEEEIIPMKIDQHHLNAESDLIESMLNHDSSIIPSSLKIDSLLDEFVGELTLLKSIPPGIDKTDCHPENEIRLTERLLYDNSSPRPPEKFVSENSDADIESFSPSPIAVEDSDSRMEEIDLSFNQDDPMPPSIEEDDDDSERDFLILEELPSNYSFSLPVNESFYFDIPSFSRPPAKPPDGNTGILNIKIMGDNSEQKVPIHGLTITRVSNQEKSPDLLSHRGLENFLSAKCPMMIHGKNIPIMDVPLFHFYPLDQFKLQVWELVDKPFGKTVIRLKWLWKKKDEGQTVICNKARLVAKGYTQEEDGRENGISKWSTKGGVYVAQLEGFVDLGHPEKVYRLRKALYGLKQAPRVGLQIHQSPCGIFINQAKYALEILHKHGMKNGQSIDTPMATKSKLDAGLRGNPVDQTDYHSKIRSRMYLTSSRPYIVQAGSNFGLTAFLDADHAGCIDTRKNTSGGIQFLGDKLVSWMSKKHDCTAMSSAKAEYVALSASYAQP
nr:hypothetical protein [Tanacetum cinerariifolium]